ncbi:hypothetical protein OV320_0688 [Actinobacteria bacterium OV320]|nr:hypothetical protein OV320_0688 [Actinobacteria bacterium OV320]
MMRRAFTDAQVLGRAGSLPARLSHLNQADAAFRLGSHP